VVLTFKTTALRASTTTLESRKQWIVVSPPKVSELTLVNRWYRARGIEEVARSLFAVHGSTFQKSTPLSQALRTIRHVLLCGVVRCHMHAD